MIKFMSSAEFCQTFLPSISSSKILKHSLKSSFSWRFVSIDLNFNQSYKYKADFSIFLEMIEFKGFLSSCDTHALIKEVNQFLALNSVYKIQFVTSNICNSFRLSLPFLYSLTLNQMYWHWFWILTPEVISVASALLFYLILNTENSSFVGFIESS